MISHLNQNPFFCGVLSIPPTTQTPSTKCTRWYFRFTRLVSSISTLTPSPPIRMSMKSRESDKTPLNKLLKRWSPHFERQTPLLSRWLNIYASSNGILVSLNKREFCIRKGGNFSKEKDFWCHLFWHLNSFLLNQCSSIIFTCFIVLYLSMIPFLIWYLRPDFSDLLSFWINF